MKLHRVERFHETDHIHGLVIPGRHRKVANPESIALGGWLWIPGSRAKARVPESHRHDSNFEIAPSRLTGRSVRHFLA
jgi:hypothetical protein